jgi:RNA polymerase sigma-70 factor, ECF subfamily
MRSWAPRDVLAAALTGDEGSVERLVQAVWPSCFRLAATILGDRGLAQDAAQEACIVVFRKVRGLRDAAAFDAWLYRVVLREALRLRRKRVAPDGLLRAWTSPGDDPTSMDVWHAMAGLPDDLRDVVVLFYFDDMKSIEIASALRIAHATVRTRLARARDRLRGLLDTYEDAPATTGREDEQHAY